MKRVYENVVAEPYDAAVALEQAIAAGAYAKKYFLENGTVGRTEYFMPRLGLYKVTYQQIEPPFDHAVAEHFGEFVEDVFCEFIVPEGTSPDGLQVEKVYLFKSPVDMEMTRIFRNERGWVVRRIFLGVDGRSMSEEHPRYNEDGDVIGRRVNDAGTGELWFDSDYSEDD